jgi:hypothetical protein
MGLFNYVTTVMSCPNCQKTLDSWQSKRLSLRGLLLANAMQSVVLDEDMDGEMHDICFDCNLAIDVEIQNGQPCSAKASPLITRDQPV